MRKHIFIAVALSIILIATGCGEATYPKEKLQESVVRLCRDEFGMDIKAEIVGRTLAIYLPLMNLFDLTLNLSESAQKKIQDVLLGASRIVLSTDADIQFYCIITQDVRLPEIQLIIVKYIQDIKRAFHHDISRGEYFKRTIIDINENPQAKKEQAIMDVFSKMQLEKEWQDKVMNDFFRSPPSSMKGIGFWQGKFYVKDITLPEFLAQQMVSRVRLRFREQQSLTKYMLKNVTGKYGKENNLEFFLIAIRVEDLLFMVDPVKRKAMETEIFENIFMEMADMIYGYKFEDFDLIKILEEHYNEKLLASKEDIYLFKRGKLGMDAILKGIN